MDQHNDKRLGEPDMGTDQSTTAPPAPTVAVTLGGTDAGPAPDANPAVGTPSAPALAAPPPLIHRAGESRPGEANPAAADVGPTGQPVVSTAQLLADREAAEEAIRRAERQGQPGMAANPPGDTPYADATDDPHLARADQGGRSALADAQPDLASLPAEENYTTLGTNETLDGPLATRVVTKEQEHGAAIQRTESMSGLSAAQSDYEHEEFGESQMNEPRDDVLLGATTGPTQAPRSAPSVTAVFSDVPSARRAIHGLLEIGIRAEEISLLAGDLGSDTEAVAGANEVVPAGEGAFRTSNEALPNDEDLPTTVEQQTGEPAATTFTPGVPGLTESDRGGLARDEGEVTRIDAPADAEIYSDFARSDADYRTTEEEGAAQTGEVPDDTVPVQHVDAGRGAVVGGLFGGLTGLLVGLGALAIPGLGPIIAAGPLVGALTGLLAGGATGGLVGALLDAGVPESHANTLSDLVARGAVLILVRTDQLTHDAVVRVLRANGAEEIH
jgi:hypothetical protein